MKRTSSFLLSLSLLCAFSNSHAYSVNEFKGDCKTAIKNSGTLVLAAGKTVFGLAALWVAVAVPVASIHQLRDTCALTGTIHGEFKKYRVNNTVVKSYSCKGYSPPPPTRPVVMTSYFSTSLLLCA